MKDVFYSEFLTFDKFEKIYNIAKGNYSSKSTPSKLYLNGEWHNFSFSMERTNGLTTTDGNASVKEYLQAKKEYFLEYIEGK